MGEGIPKQALPRVRSLSDTVQSVPDAVRAELWIPWSSNYLKSEFRWFAKAIVDFITAPEKTNHLPASTTGSAELPGIPKNEVWTKPVLKNLSPATHPLVS